MDLLQRLMGKSVGGMPVVILQYAKIKIFRGYCFAYILFGFFSLYFFLVFFNVLLAFE